jgi:hypothetical protein
VADVLKMVIGATAKSAKKEIDSTAKSLSGLDAAASKIAKVGFAVMATAGVAVTAAIVGIAKSAVTLSSDLNQVAKEARQVGAAIEELDTAQGVLDLMTSGSVRAGRAFQDLQRNLADARDGTGEAKDALEKLNLTVEDLSGMTLAETLATVGDRFGTLRDDAEQSQVAMDIFGRAGRGVVGALREGGDAIRSAAEDIERTGVVSAAAGLSAEQLQDSILLLRRSVDALKREALVPLMPVLAGVADFLADLAVGFRDTGDDAETLGDIVHTAFMEQILPAVFTATSQSKKALTGFHSTILETTRLAKLAELGFRGMATGWQYWGTVVGITDDSVVASSLKVMKALSDEIDVVSTARDKATADFASADEEALAAFDSLLASIRSAASVDMPKFSGRADDAAGSLLGVADAAAETEASLARLEAGVRFLGLDEGAAAALRFSDNMELLDAALDSDIITADQYYERIQFLREEMDALGQASLEMAEKSALAWGTAEDHARLYEDSLSGVQGALGSVSTFAGLVGDAVATMHGENSKEAAEAAKTVFGIQQALALAIATVDMFRAIAAANALGYPQSIPAMIAAGVTGGLQIAGIAATTIAGAVADSGLTPEMVRRATSGSGYTTAIVQSGEAVIDRTGTAEISRMLALQRRQMQGGSGGGGTRVVNNRPIYLDRRGRHQLGWVVDEHLVESAERGRPYQNRIRAGRGI